MPQALAIIPVPDPCRCPLCGQPNACAMALPDSATPALDTVSKARGAAQPEPCWCTRVSFSADLLSQVPEAARQKACICAACVAASGDPSRDEGA